MGSRASLIYYLAQILMANTFLNVQDFIHVEYGKFTFARRYSDFLHSANLYGISQTLKNTRKNFQMLSFCDIFNKSRSNDDHFYWETCGQ